jgi:hypothetical protein
MPSMQGCCVGICRMHDALQFWKWYVMTMFFLRCDFAKLLIHLPG